MDRSRRQYTCGLVVNDQVSVPSSVRRKIRQEMYMIQKYGLDSHLRKIQYEGSEEEYLNSLLGRVGFVLSIQASDEFLRYKQTLLRMMKKRNI